jgi:hypothetical protein
LAEDTLTSKTEIRPEIDHANETVLWETYLSEDRLQSPKKATLLRWRYFSMRTQFYSGDVMSSPRLSSAQTKSSRPRSVIPTNANFSIERKRQNSDFFTWRRWKICIRDSICALISTNDLSALPNQSRSVNGVETSTFSKTGWTHGTTGSTITYETAFLDHGNPAQTVGAR